MNKNLLLFFFVSVAAVVAAPIEWHVIKSEQLGVLPGSAVMKSITLQHVCFSGHVEEATIEAIVFSEKKERLVVIDNPKQERSLLEVMQTGFFIAGMNGGYFHPDSTPLGLIMHDGKILHAQEKARLLSGFFVANEHQLGLVRVGEPMPHAVSEIIQAGPFLVDHHQSVVGLESTRIAWRSFLATDGHGNWVMGKISPVTLATASHLLLAAQSKFFPDILERALNMDGGSSTALWVDTTPKSFSFNENVHVRNFLGLELR